MDFSTRLFKLKTEKCKLPSEVMVLTSFECHDAFQTGKLCRIEAHLSESGDHLLKCLYLSHDLSHPLRLCVFSVHSCQEWWSKMSLCRMTLQHSLTANTFIFAAHGAC